MSQAPWPEVEQIMAAALDLPESERAAYVARRCAERPEIRAEVESLLAADGSAGDFLRAQTGWGGMAACTGSLTSRHIGPYLLLDEIGRGGMGVVYRAGRDDGRFQKQVAVKIMTAAINSPEMLQRFRGEQQILATLEHPNIARLLDAGVSEDGLPYIVMEYVAGVSIHQYCGERRLPVAERLTLFRTICSTVHYAHQHLVVHRDLKPGNILVTDQGVPKLLDFGIAKILGGWPEAAPAPERTLLNPLTPDYASPEQLRGASITTASDVYSLGVLLFELLTGERPYHLAGKTLDEAMRVVCETTPRKPSTAAPLSADLDAIVAKAMRKEPEQRYASAEELSTDVGRHIAGLPVWAHRGSFRYVARKFVARHRFGVGIALLGVLLAAGSGAAIARQARIAERERARAERRFLEVRQLAHSVLFELYDGVASLAGATEVRKLLVTRALQYLDSLSREVAGDAPLQMELAAAYTRVGDVQGNSGFANLGDTTGALASYAKAREILEAILARDPKRLDARRSLATLCLTISGVHLFVRNGAVALASAREGLKMWEALARQSPPDEEPRRGLGDAYLRIADALSEADPNGSIANLNKSLEFFQALLAAHPDSPAEQRSVARIEKNLCSRYATLLDRVRDLEHCRKAEELDERRVAVNPADPLAKLDLSLDLSMIGTLYFNRHNFKEALGRFRRTLEMRRALAEADPRDARGRGRLAFAYLRVGEVLAKMGNPRAAMDHFKPAAAISEALAASSPADSVALAYLAEAHGRIGDAEAVLSHMAAGEPQRAEHRLIACSLYRRALEEYRKLEERGVAHVWEHEDARHVARECARCDSFKRS